MAVTFKPPRGNEITRPPLDVDLTTDAGRSAEFVQEATECLHRAQTLHEHRAGLTGEYILVFHAIELALKGFLARFGLSNEQLSKSPYGHNLIGLYSEAAKHGLKLSTHEAERYLEGINTYHDKGVIRYQFAKLREYPNCSCLFPITEEILAAIKK